MFLFVNLHNVKITTSLNTRVILDTSAEDILFINIYATLAINKARATRFYVLNIISIGKCIIFGNL